MDLPLLIYPNTCENQGHFQQARISSFFIFILIHLFTKDKASSFIQNRINEVRQMLFKIDIFDFKTS